MVERGESCDIRLEQTRSGYLVRPNGKPPFPGVLVIHELFGLTDDMRRIADKFADAGYAALAIDLAPVRSRVMCMARLWAAVQDPMSRNSVVRDLRDVLAWLGRQAGVDPARLGVIGFCMGGRYALELACTPDGPRVAAVFYGTNPEPLDAVARACPIVGSYPAIDFTASGAAQLRKKLTQHGKPHDIKVYPWRFHSFMNASWPWPIRSSSAAQDAWERTLSFFREHLALGPPE